jgi:ankyrin repeat protein
VRDLVDAIVQDETEALRLLAASPALARARLEQGATRQGPKEYFLEAIACHIYQGDTPLHVAAAAYRAGLARQLLTQGADVHARNRRGATPLHSAVRGGPGAASWAPEAQVAMICLLIAAGADPNAVDKGGVTPLHRAVRNRCAAAVRSLLEGGADARRKNKSGSTALTLAQHNTGRGGTGSAEAKAEQSEILRLLGPQ